MSLFNEIQGYKKPIVITVNAHVSMAIYQPEKKHIDKKSIISVYNTKENTKIQLYSDTLVNICDIFINSMLLNTLPKSIKKVSRKKKSKK